MKKLYSYDFDDTLVYSPRPENGKKTWEEETGETWPYNGWWSKVETLDTDIFYIPKNEWVYKEYLKSKAEGDSYMILATGRLDKIKGMRESIEKILIQHNLSFDEIHLNWGSDTFKFKTTLFEKLIEKTKCEHFIMYDDRFEHLKNFKKWATNQDIKITIVDVVNKKKYNFN